MKRLFDLKVYGRKLLKVIEAPDELGLIEGIRNYAATQIPKIPIIREDDKLREALDVDGMGDWTNQQFYQFTIDYYNKHMAGDRPRLPVPATEQDGKPTTDLEQAREYLQLATEAGFVKEV